MTNAIRKFSLAILVSVIVGAWVGMFFDWDRRDRERVAFVKCVTENSDLVPYDAMKVCEFHLSGWSQ